MSKHPDNQIVGVWHNWDTNSHFYVKGSILPKDGKVVNTINNLTKAIKANPRCEVLIIDSIGGLKRVRIHSK